MRGLLILSFLMTLNVVVLLAQPSGVVEGIQKAFTERAITQLNPYLSDDFRLAGGTAGEAQRNLSYFLKTYPFESLKFIGEQVVDSIRNIQFEFSRKEGAVVKMAIALNAQGKIVYMDLVDQYFGMNRNQDSKLLGIVPFENHSGKMIITLKINDYPIPLRFLFDTGADGMAVNPALAEKIGLKVTRSNDAAVVGGNMQIRVSDGNSIHFGDLTLQRMGIAIFDQMGKDVDGLLGNAFLRRYITEIDYDNNQIKLYSFGRGAPVGEGHAVDIQVPNGLILIPVDVTIAKDKGGKGNFVFDSGASYNLIGFRNFVQRHKLLVGGFISKQEGSTVSMGMQTPTFSGITEKIQIGNLQPDVAAPISLMAGYKDSDKNLPHDGSLGVRLLSRYNMLVNLQEGRVYFKPNKLHDLPTDFMVGSYVFGWDNAGVLRVVGGGPKTDKERRFAEGTEVTSINKKKSAEFGKNKGKSLKKLLATDKPIQLELSIDGEVFRYSGKS